MKYTVLLSDGTVGTVFSNEAEEQLIDSTVIGARLADENGKPIEVTNTVTEILKAEEY